MNILPLIPRKLNLGVERLAEVALSMKEPMIAEIFESNEETTLFLKNKNGIILYRITITSKERDLFFSKFREDSKPKFVTCDVIAKGYSR
jgi:hypothetical protein